MKTLTSISELSGQGRILIYGSGRRGRLLAGLLDKLRGLAPAAYLDSSRSGTLDGVPIIPLAEYRPEPGDEVVVASAFWPEIVRALDERGIRDFWVLREAASEVLCFVDITSRCNVKCRFCPYLNNPDRPIGPDWDLDRFRIAHAQFSFARGVSFCSAGGEPLLNPHLEDMCLFLKERGQDAEFYTNGLALGRLIERPGLREAVDFVKMSFVSPRAEVQERWMRGTSLAVVEQALTGLARFAKRPALALMAVLMTENAAHLADILRFAREVGACEVNCTYMRPGPDPYLRAHSLEYGGKPGDRALWLAQRDEALALAREAGIRLTFEVKLDHLFAEFEGRPRVLPQGEGGLTRLCLQPWEFLYVLNNGDVSPCCYGGQNRVGNVFKPRDLVFGGYAHLLLKDRLSQGRLRGPCRGCESAPMGTVAELRDMVREKFK